MSRSLFLISLWLTWFAFNCASASAGPIAELAEWMLKQGAKFTDDIAGKGSRELTLELEQLSAKTGDEAVEQLIMKGGNGSLSAVRELGDHAPDAVRLIGRHGVAGKLVVQQGKSAAVDVFREFGDDGVRVLIQQGAASGGKMLSVYGKALADSAKDLTPESMARLRHWLPQVETAAPEWRSAFCDRLRRGGDDFVVWVHRRWKEVAALGGLTVAGITLYKVGDGVAAVIPNPSKDPVGWIAWWIPLIIVVVVVAIAWVARSRLAARIW